MSEPMASTTSSSAPATRSTSPRWLTVVVAALFGLFYAYDIWEAVGNLVGISAAASSLDTTLSGLGWTVLVSAILLPAIIFGVALWIGRRRSAGVLALLLLAGLALSAVLALDIYVLFGVGSLIA